MLRDYEAYRAAGVHLPKGLLLHGTPGCGKTQIAKTLSAEAGLNFAALSTSDCKAMWIGWSADRLASVFREAREKQPTLLFIDELDAVCSLRGAYADCVSQEFTAQLLQKIDGFLSDAQAIFFGRSHCPDQIDFAVLSRFSEQIEIPMPDQSTRAALLEVFLRPLRLRGDRSHAILNLALATDGRSGRDLRALVNQAVLAGVRRTSSPRDFMLTEKDFGLLQKLKEIVELRVWKRIYLSWFVRLNLYTRGFTISLGHRGIDWITSERRGIRETLATGIPGIYLSEGQQWRDIAATARRRW